MEAVVMPWGVDLLPVFGLVAAWLSRSTAGMHRLAFQWLFIACLVLVGVGMALLLKLNMEGFFLYGVAFGTMVILATCEPVRSEAAARL